MSVKNFVVETAAIVAGLFVKKGTADNGVVKSTAGDVSYGLSKGSTPTEEIAVGDHLSVALMGEVAPALLAATITAGADVTPDANGKAVAVVPTDNRVFRGGIAIQSGVPGEMIDIIVTSDYVSTVTIT